jgi:3-isopropylmalate dehydratase small subunit
MTLQGRVWKYGDDIDTDVIIPARYLNTTGPAELARHCLEDLDRHFAGQVKAGDIIVAGKNFGCGSSREHAPLSIKGTGVAAVVAASFARIFYRNAVNIGLAILESPEAAEAAASGDLLEINVEQGIIRNLTRGQTYRTAPFPEFMQDIMKAGGLIGYVKRKLGR